MDFLRIASRVALPNTAVPESMTASPRTVKGEITLTIEVTDEQPDMGRSDEELLMSAAETLAEGAGDNSWAGDGAYVTGVAGVRVAGEEEPEDPGPPSDPGSPYDTLEEKKGLK